MRRNYALNLTLSAGLFMGETLSEVLFLSHFGVAALPLGLIGTALLGVALTTIYTRALSRRPSGILLAAVIVVVAILNLLIWGALEAGVTWAVLALFLLFRPSRDLLQAQIWNYFADQYDTQESKVRFPVISAAGRIGAISGAAALPLLLNSVGSGGTMLAWVFCLVAGLVVMWVGHGPVTVHNVVPPAPSAAGPPLMASPLARALTTGAALVVMLVLLLTYQTSGALVAAFPDERLLGTLYATVAVVSNLVGWAFQTFGMPQLIRAIGVSRTNLIYPAAALSVSVWIGMSGSVSAAVAGQVVRTTLRQSLQVPAEDLLMNALPAALRARMRAIVRGAVVPLGATIGSLLILGLQATGWGVPVIPWLSALVAVGALAAALWVRRAYSEATMALAHEQNPIAQRLAFAGFGSADPETLRLLQGRLAATESLEDQVFLGRILIELDRVAAEKALTARITTSPPESQAALLGLLRESDIAGEPLLALAPRLLRSPNPEVRRALLDALMGVRALATSLYRRALDDPDPGVQLAAARLLLPSYPNDARARLITLSTGDSPELRARALEVLGALGQEQLVRGLGDPVPLVRLAVADVAGRLELARMPALTVALGAALTDPVESVRRAVASALGRAGTAQAELLIGAMADRSPAVRTAAVESLIQIGPDCLPILQARLTGATSLDQREAILIALARLSPGQQLADLDTFELAILEQIVTLLRVRPALGKLPGPVGTLLFDDMAAEKRDLLNRLAALVAATSGAETSRSIWQGLSSPDRNLRAQASEALESVRSPWQARLLTALLRPDDVPERALALAAQRWPQPTLRREEAWALASSEGTPWRRDLVAAAMAEQRPASIAITPTSIEEGGVTVLSVVEKAIFLRAVPIFQAMAPEQLQILASAGEELEYLRGAAIFSAGDSADRLFVIVSGRVGIEETRARGNVVRIATLEAKEPFGELAVFDAPAHTTSAVAVDDCYILAIRREVLLDLISQHPDLALTIIKFLSRRLREASSTIAEKTRARPRQIVDLFDKMSEG